MVFYRGFSSVFCVGNYKGHIKGMWTSTMVPQMLGIDFLWYSFYRENFAPIASNESCSICSGVLVDFMFGIDSQETG